MKLKKIDNVWHVQFQTATGKSKTITTRCTEKEEALKVVKEAGIADLEAAAKAGRLAREAIGHIMTGKKLTMEKALDQYEESILRRRAAKTAANNMTVLKTWAKEMSILNLPPSAVTEKHIDQWINNPESELKAQTRRLNLSAIRTFFDFCIEHGWTPTNPAGRNRVSVNMRLLSHAQKEIKKVEPFNAQEVSQLIKHLKQKGDQFWEFAVRVSYEVGLRLGDICQLEWNCFSQPGEIIVWTDKRDKRVAVPISHEVLQLSTEIPIRSDLFLWPDQAEMTRDPVKRAALSVQFGRILKKLGIKNRTFHSLRHTRITEWAKKGISLEQIAKDVGHSNTKTTKGYVH